MKGKELASNILLSISHPLRMTIIERLEAQPKTFSGIMILCGLEPNFDSGLFTYHLSELIRKEIVEKDGELYRLTDFGRSVLQILKATESECTFFLERKEDKNRKEVKKMKEEAVARPPLVDMQLSAYDFFPTKPGEYAIYKVWDAYTGLKCKVESVLQYSDKETFLVTLVGINSSDDQLARFLDSSIFCKIHSGQISYSMGCPVSNQGFLWMLLSIPITFRDEDTWQLRQIRYKASWIGNLKVGSEAFEDCVKIHVNNPEEKQVLFIKGEGDIYLSKGIGIVRYDFARSNLPGSFSAEILEHGRLSARTISGRIIEGNPAETYRVGLANCGKESECAKNTDSEGMFSIKVYGHSVKIKYGSLRTRGDLMYIPEPKTRRIENLTKDISDLELSMRAPTSDL